MISALRANRASQQIGVAFPTGRFGCSEFRIDLFEGFSFGFDVCFRVVIRCLELDVPEPASDDGHIDAGGDKLNRRRAPEDMRRDSLLRESRNALRGRADVLTQT